MECALLRRSYQILNTSFLPAKDWVFSRGVDPAGLIIPTRAEYSYPRIHRRVNPWPCIVSVEERGLQLRHSTPHKRRVWIFPDIPSRNVRTEKYVCRTADVLPLMLSCPYRYEKGVWRDHLLA